MHAHAATYVWRACVVQRPAPSAWICLAIAAALWVRGALWQGQLEPSRLFSEGLAKGLSAQRLDSLLMVFGIVVDDDV